MISWDNYEDWIKTVPKCDLHCHAARGAGLKYLSDIAQKKIIEADGFSSVNEMNQWYKNEIGSVFQGRNGYETLIRATIDEAIRDNIYFLVMGFAVDRVALYNDSVSAFIKAISKIIRSYKRIVIIPELSIPKTVNYKKNIMVGMAALEYNFFKAIDIVGEEMEVAFDEFVELYKTAKTRGLRLRAHVGEFGSADSIMRTCNLLDLDEVQHGISAIESEEVMSFLKDKGIQLNICPTSNIKMHVVSDYKNHPIKKLLDYGIKVTINTDDRTVFNRSVSEEFTQLYKSGLLSINELERIRKETLCRAEALWGNLYNLD